MGKSILSFALFLAAKFCFADLGPIKVRESIYFREIEVNGKNILIHKKSGTAGVFGNDKSMKISFKKGIETFSFNKRAGDRDSYLYGYKSSTRKSIGYFSRNTSIFFKSSEAACDLKTPFKNFLEDLASPELNAQINNLQIENLFDKQSCAKINSEQIEELKIILGNVFKSQKSQLMKCFKSKHAQDVFSKDTALLQSSVEVFGKYLNLIKLVGDGKAKLKIKCGLPVNSKNKVAAFTENPLVVALQTFDDKFNLGLEDITDALGHELIHYGSQQFKDRPESKCIDEGVTQLLEKTCSYIPKEGVSPPIHSSKIVTSCLKGKNIKLGMDSHASEAEGEGGGEDQSFGAVVAAIAQAPLENRYENQVGTLAIVEAINSGKAVAFEPIPEETVKAVAAAEVTTTTGRSISFYEGDGGFHTVIPDADFSRGVQQIQTNLARNMDSAEALIGTALGATGFAAATVAMGSSAIASTSSAGLITPMPSTETFATRYLQDNPEFQKTMDDPKLAKMSYEEKETYYCSRDPSICKKVGGGDAAGSLAGNVKAGEPVPDKAANDIKAVGGSVNSAGLRAGGTLGDLTRKVASAGPESKARISGPVGAGGTVYHESGASSSTDIPSSSTRAPAAVQSPKLDNAILQRLTAFNKVNEPAYSRVVERFDDVIFRQQMNARRIRVVNEQGKPLWSSTSKPQKCFRDNKTTKVLESVECR